MKNYKYYNKRQYSGKAIKVITDVDFVFIYYITLRFSDNNKYCTLI